MSPAVWPPRYDRGCGYDSVVMVGPPHVELFLKDERTGGGEERGANVSKEGRGEVMKTLSLAAAGSF